MQTCQLTRILRETLAKGQSLTLTRKHKIVSHILIKKKEVCLLIFNPVSTDLVAHARWTLWLWMLSLTQTLTVMSVKMKILLPQ